MSESLVAAYDGPTEDIYEEPGSFRPSASSQTEAKRPKVTRSRVMFLYLGSGGGFGQFTRQLVETVGDLENFEATIAVASANRATPSLCALTDAVVQLPSGKDRSLFSIFANFWQARQQLLARLAEARPAAVVALMPHVWTPLLATAVKQLGIRYISIAHDAVPHPGDPTGILTPWLLRDAEAADLVVTLSRSVAERIVLDGHATADRVVSLFHPDLNHGVATVRRRDPRSPLRLLFFGRILKYKGLPLLIDAIERLRAEGLDVRLGVAGQGNLDGMQGRLTALGAEVINRWIDDDEVGPLLARYDAIALSHVEASQSGVAAMAFGHSIPVVGMPVGGLVEQIVDGRTGVLGGEATAKALAAGIRRLATDAALYDGISAHLHTSAGERSMTRFVGSLMTELDRRFAGR